jgi:molybdopterin synthase catalytic subunit/molybdopterin converting factor small subunit
MGAMVLRIVYFALLRERLGRSEELLELAEDLHGPVSNGSNGSKAGPASPVTVADALAALTARHEVLAGMGRSLLLAVNQALVPPDFPLQDGDELALLPPVSGGSAADAAAPLLPRCRISRDPLQVQPVLDAVSGPGQGGLVLFCGMVREHNRGQSIVRLDYEAYDAMAVRSMTVIADEIEAASPGVRLAVVHRVGSLTIGELAVLIAASAPHRAEAFAACRETIERLKKEVPIWKKEFSADGAEWLGGGG